MAFVPEIRVWIKIFSRGKIPYVRLQFAHNEFKI